MNEEIATSENILFPIITVLGLTANAFVIAVILVAEKYRKNRTVANTFVLNLAIADILFLLILPFYTPSLHINGYPYTVAACKFLEAVKHVSYHASILFLVGMSVDRYVAIVHSLQSLEYRTQHNARILCAVLWIISIVVSSPIVAFSYLEISGSNLTSVATCRQMFPGYETKFVALDVLYEGGMSDPYYDANESTSSNASYDYAATLDELQVFPTTDPFYNGNESSSSNASYDFAATIDDITAANQSKVCVDKGHEKSDSFRAWQWITFCVFFVIPVLIVIFCYVKIWRATAVREVRSQQADEVQTKITIMVAVLISAFIICWMPFQMWSLLTLHPGVEVSDSKQCAITNMIVTLLAWSNSVLNPLLYSITSENFRQRAVTTMFYMRYGYRRTMQMSTTRGSRTGHGMRSTAITTVSQHGTASPKGRRRLELKPMSQTRT